ncbi:hypothetical protein [Achromobacter anxifer]|jgi:hypothetical protein|uniref:Uncharacterized protein n=1 Tax=Achromobacter anxifer TaxID=1287737 RepID=A0A6S7C0L1_9BURK|nr:hypothetical protein [Achromobacter anxifer]MDF8365558.1 hypothetical protein [Achromobacter anxifer]CAB3825975.1 hypothetical protein LMG26858_00439 [Achromobacter anxifer]CAB5515038.1 hypothetical protein LMG26857_04102 [Achromobacter anxifer]
MAPSTSFPADGAPDNLWTEYARFHESCSRVLDRIEYHRDSGLALSESELSELRTMILNLNAFGRLLHGKRGKEMRMLARRANLALGNASDESLVEIQEGDEAEDNPATVTG